ncbi:hypothetical protein DMX09_21975 [Pseudomonas protegens]|nr:hypothetical protein DMX09_21975 [Pseudomonas protegens]RXU61975.1 hypothetical protein CW358_24290 [Pseudomonas protegens]
MFSIGINVAFQVLLIIIKKMMAIAYIASVQLFGIIARDKSAPRKAVKIIYFPYDFNRDANEPSSHQA